MQKKSATRIVAVLALCLALTGCAGWPWKPETADQMAARTLLESCKSIPTPKPGFNLNFQGIEVPWKPQNPVKIGSVTFNATEAMRVSDAIYALSESRQSQCVYVAGALLGNPKPTGDRILEAMNTFKAGERASEDLKTLLQTPDADPKLVAAFAEKVKLEVEHQTRTTQQILKPGAEVRKPAKVGMSDLEDDLASDIRQGLQVGSVKSSLEELRKEVESLQAAPHRLISIGGFPRNSVALTAGMKNQLSAQFSQALSDAKGRPVPRVAVVGFADESGSYLRNVELGLRRAQLVAAFLERSFSGQAYIAIVSSGGVLNEAENGRRVDVLIS